MVNTGLVGVTAIITFSIVFIIFYYREQVAKKPEKPTHSMKVSEAIRKILFLNYDLNQVGFELSLLIVMGVFFYFIGIVYF